MSRAVHVVRDEAQVETYHQEKSDSDCELHGITQVSSEFYSQNITLYDQPTAC